MSLLFADRVKENVSSIGTGTFNLSGAVADFQSFVAGIGSGNSCYYAAADGVAAWEVGVGTVTSGTPNLLSRTTILASSNSGSVVNFTTGPTVANVSPAAFFQALVNTTNTGYVLTSAQNALPTWTSTSGASSIVARDANQNITANNYSAGVASTVASSTPVTLTVASAPIRLVTGSTNQKFNLPNATTLIAGTPFYFNNGTTASSVQIYANDTTTLIATVPAGGSTTVIVNSISTSNGAWTVISYVPTTASFGSSTLNYSGTITSATWNGATVSYAYGGTGNTVAPTAGGLAYGDGTKYIPMAAGTTGQILLSGGAGAPTWSNGAVYTKTSFTATAGQTSFSVTYTVGYLDVFYNGSKLSTSEYTATTGTTVVLGTACNAGDIVETIAWAIWSVTNTNIGIGTGTSLALGGATIGSNALAVTGTTLLNNALTYGGVTLTNNVTGTGKMVLDTSPTLVTPALGVATATSLAIGGATLGANALAVTGKAAISSNATISGGALYLYVSGVQMVKAIQTGGVAPGGSISLDTETGGGSWAGDLVICSVRTSNANARTQNCYRMVARGSTIDNDDVISGSGSSSMSMGLTYTNGNFVLTNNDSNAANLAIMWTGTGCG